MKRVGLVTLAVLMFGAAACDDNGTQVGNCASGVTECVVPYDCAPGFTCGESGCCEEFGCTPTSCPAGEFCAEDLTCTSISKQCLKFGCECHILNTAGEFEASGNPTITLAPGASFSLTAVLAAQGGTPLPGAIFTWGVDQGTFTVSGTTLTANASGSRGTATLTADADGFAMCQATLVNLGDGPTGNDVRFFVYNDATGAPIEGATLYVDYSPYDGTPDQTLTSDANGLASTTGAQAGTFAVSAFKVDPDDTSERYNYLSVVGLSAPDFSENNDFVLPMTARPAVKETGGFTGKPDFGPYETIVLGGVPKTIKFGIVSSSFPLRSLLNFDLDMFIGPITDEDCSIVDPVTGLRASGCYIINIPGLVDNEAAALPGGVVLSLARNPIKGHFDVVATPGRRYGWALGGEVEVADLAGLINLITPMLGDCNCDATNECDAACSCDSDCGINFGELFDNLVPLFSVFASGVKGNLPLIAEPLATWEAHIQPPYGASRTDHASFPKLDTPGRGKMALREPLQVFTDFFAPALPPDPDFVGIDDRKMEGMLVLTGVNTQGFGFVPLGIGAGLDCTEGNCLDRNAAIEPGEFDGDVNGGLVCFFSPDPKLNGCPPSIPYPVNEFGLSKGHIGLFHGRAHGGLEGQEWLTLAVALPISSLTSDDVGIRASILALREEPSDAAAGPSSQLSSMTFPKFPTQPATTNGRVYAVTSTTGVDIHWVTVASDADPATGFTVRWNIFLPNSDIGFFAPPVPPDVLPGVDNRNPFDPASGTGDIAANHVNATHVGFRVTGGATVASLAAADGTTLSDLVNETDGFTIQTRDICALATCL